MKKGIIITIIAMIAVIIAIVFAVNSVPANAIAYEEKVTESYSNIKVYEKKRADLLPNLADAIKAYDKHEYETLMNVIEARTAKDGTVSDEALTEIKNMVNVVMEAYPELKSNENYKEFMKESAIIENQIVEARKAYNSAVSRYNTYTNNPLRKMFLNMTGYEKIEFEKLDYDVSEDAPTKLFN